MAFLALFKISPWTYLLFLMKPSYQASPDDIKDTLQEMKTLLFDRLDEMNARLVAMENTIANDIKVNIEKISTNIDNDSKQIYQMKEDFKSCNSILNTLSQRSVEICSTIDDHKVKLDNTLNNTLMIMSKIEDQNVHLDTTINNSKMMVRNINEQSVSLDIILKNTAKMISKIGEHDVDLGTTYNKTAIMVNKTVEHEECASPWVSVGMSRCLLFRQEKMDWGSARTACRNDGGDLAILEEEAKRTAVDNYMKSAGLTGDPHYYWVGSWRYYVSDWRSAVWRWMNGNAVRGGWSDGGSCCVAQPDHKSSEDDTSCMFVWVAPEQYGLLWDGPCTDTTYFICEK